MAKLVHGLADDLAEADTGPEADTHCRHAAFVPGCIGNTVGDLILRVALHVADHVHADLLVEDLLQLLGQRHVLDDQRIERQAVFGEHRCRLGEHRLAELVLVGRHVNEGHAGFAEQVGQAGDQDQQVERDQQDGALGVHGQAEVPAGNRQFAVVNGTVELAKQVTVQWLLASPAKPDAVQYKNVLALRSYDWTDNRKELAASISLRRHGGLKTE